MQQKRHELCLDLDLTHFMSIVFMQHVVQKIKLLRRLCNRLECNVKE